MQTSLSTIEERIGYTFTDSSYLLTALTHSSFTQHGQNNERLEFLGDAVLELTISEYLYNHLHDSEGRMTKLRANIVCAESLSMAATDLGLGQALRLGKGERNTGGAKRRSNLANVYEAVIGAVFLDSNYETAREMILRTLNQNIKLALSGKLVRDYKTELQERIQKQPGRQIQYVDLEATGPDHDRIFHTKLLIDGKDVAKGSGRTKKEAEQEAAKSWLHAVIKPIGGKN